MNTMHGKLEQVFDHFPKYHMEILLGDFNAKAGREIFKPTIGNESLQIKHHTVCIYSTHHLELQVDCDTFYISFMRSCKVI